MKYWHCNFACFKAKIRECSDITKLLRGWSRGVWTHYSMLHMGVTCIMIRKILFDTSGKKYTLKRGGTKWSPFPHYENPSPLPQFGKWLCGGVRFTGNLESIKNQIANFWQHGVVVLFCFFSSGQKKWNPAFHFGADISF